MCVHVNKHFFLSQNEIPLSSVANHIIKMSLMQILLKYATNYIQLPFEMRIKQNIAKIRRM